MSALVVTVTPTIMSGTVVRWFESLDHAERCHPFLSASRDEVITHVEGVVTPDLRQQVDAVQAALKVGNRETVERLATHRREGLIGPIVEVAS